MSSTPRQTFQGVANRRVGQLSPWDEARLEETVYICSIVPWSPYNVHGQSGHLEIPACPKQPDGTYSKFILVPIKGYVSYIGFGDDQFQPQVISAQEQVADVLGRLGPNQGVFLPADQKGGPSEQELADCRARWERTGKALIEESEKWWGRSKNPRVIDDRARWFVQYFGWKRDWAGETVTLQNCPSCRAKCEPGALRCATCRYVLDWQRAFDLAALTPEEEERGLDRGLIQPRTEKPAAAGKGK